MQNINGQSALITAGSTEVAGSIAAALAEQGVKVCLTGKISGALEPKAERIRAAGGFCLPVASPLDTLEDAEALVARVMEAYGRLDILVLVAGIWGGAAIAEHPLKTWDLVMSSNLREPFLVARSALPRMLAQGSGQVVGIGSDSSLGIYPREGAFSVAMHGFNTLLDLIRAENSERGIRTHVLCPGLMLTPSGDAPPALSPADVADWVVFALTRPPYLRGLSPTQI